ncbi:MAG: hypothetical protein PVF48_13920, partial [Syntrophobacterales bacterium]
NWGPARRAGSPEDQYWNLRFVCNFSFGVPTPWVGPQFGAWILGFYRLHYASEKPSLVGSGFLIL